MEQAKKTTEELFAEAAARLVAKKASAKVVCDTKKAPATKTVAAAKTAKTAKVTKPCPCGCGESPRGGVFVPGHDGRVSGWFRQIEAKAKKVTDIPKSAQAVFAQWTKLGKPGGKHPHVREAATKAS